MPDFSAIKQRWETSIQRIDGLTIAEAWELGYRYAENLPAGRRIKARGTASLEIIVAQGLGLEVNGPPFPRHVDIVNWPAGSKDERLMKATEIANKMTLELNPRAAI
jgi:hypothetical protein